MLTKSYAQLGNLQPTALVAQRVRVTVDNGGLHVERRDGLSGWTTSHRLRWPDLRSMYMDTGTFDNCLGLYVTMAVNGARRHILDAKLLTRREWATLTKAVIGHSKGKVAFDLSGFEKTRPYNEF